jgi:membrane protein DedA with SNARE-associated domain
VKLPLLVMDAATKPLPGVFHHLEGPLEHYGYLAVATFLFFEDFGVPLPGETMLIAASIYAGTGHLNVWAVGIVAFVAAVLGDNVGYVIGRKGGIRLVHRYGKYFLITPERLQKAHDFFEHRGGWVVTIARFVEGLRQLNGVIAGTVGMPWKRFLFFNMLGAALWVGTWTTLGYLAGNNVETIARYFTLVAAATVVVAAGYITWRLRHRRRNKRAAAAAEAEPAPATSDS